MKTTNALVKELTENGQDFEFYPSTQAQIAIVVEDIKNIAKDFSFPSSNRHGLTLMDVGAGDGRVLQQIKKDVICDEIDSVTTFAIEKASIHTAAYADKDITLLGTEFHEINFIDKVADVAFVNPPYSQFSAWLKTLITYLDFGILYTIVPERWINDLGIQEAMRLRGIKCSEVLAESDFLDADRKARCKVQIVRFSFSDFQIDEKHDFRRHNYRPSVVNCGNDPFSLFVEQELSLHPFSEAYTTFSEHIEKERIEDDMLTEGSQSFDLVQSKGILLALIDGYNKDITDTLDQYKLIGALDSSLLKEMGVDYDSLKKGIRAKISGFRNVYWSLLFNKLDALTSKLTSKNKRRFLNELNANKLDFTYKNAIYIVDFAVKQANRLIEDSLISVFKDLTSPESISRYYKSNLHVLNDSWRYAKEESFSKAKYLLDYRFIYSSYENIDKYRGGLNESAASFTRDLVVVFNLLGYTSVYIDRPFNLMSAGDKISIWGVESGETIELVSIKYYKNGSRHLRFQQNALLKFNIIISRLLGWVRDKTEFSEESGSKPINDDVWGVSDGLKVSSNSLPLLLNAA